MSGGRVALRVRDKILFGGERPKLCLSWEETFSSSSAATAADERRME